MHATITSGTALLFATLGGILTARAGVLNMGIEGIMLMGCFSGYAGALVTGSPWAGLLVALAVGTLSGLLYGLVAIEFKANQAVTGLAFVMLGTGLSGFLGRAFVGQPLAQTFVPVKMPLLGDIPVLGPAVFYQDPLVYLSYLLVPALWWFIFRSRPGLHLRAAGENPAAADSAGIRVSTLRYLYTAIGGALMGAAGAYLSLAYSPAWLENMTSGRGWIAVALVVFSGWNPFGALAGAYLFGGIDSITLRLQAAGVDISTIALSMLPYLFTILVLILSALGKRSAVGPAALGLAYDRENALTVTIFRPPLIRLAGTRQLPDLSLSWRWPRQNDMVLLV